MFYRAFAQPDGTEDAHPDTTIPEVRSYTLLLKSTESSPQPSAILHTRRDKNCEIWPQFSKKLSSRPCLKTEQYYL